MYGYIARVGVCYNTLTSNRATTIYEVSERVNILHINGRRPRVSMKMGPLKISIAASAKHTVTPR